MGRQASALCHWKDQRAQVDALLESTEIILRGDIRARISRASISAIDARDGILSLAADGGTLTLDLGPAEAEKWASILAKPPPSLTEKLGLTPSMKAFVIGTVTDDILGAALAGLTTTISTEAAYLIAEIHTAADLSHACRLATSHPQAPIWLIHEKGRAAALPDGDIRATLRGQSYIDTKSTAISAAMTGTLYRPRR